MSSLSDYWRTRVRTSVDDFKYKGVQLAKMPEDLAIYHEIIWETRPDTIIELGAAAGGSALWFADQLRLLPGTRRVISVDILSPKITDPTVITITGDLSDEAVARKVGGYVNGTTMVIEDSAHTYSTTKAALRLYGHFVSVGCYFVVEDTIIEDKEHCPEEWYRPQSVGLALDEFMANNQDWERVTHDKFTVTMHERGWLRRVR